MPGCVTSDLLYAITNSNNVVDEYIQYKSIKNVIVSRKDQKMYNGNERDRA